MQTIRGCPGHRSFCSVWRTDGQKPRQRTLEKVIDEIIELRRIGFRFTALADDNFYPVTCTDLRLARENNLDKLESLTAIRSRAIPADGGVGEAAERTWCSSPDHDGIGRGHGILWTLCGGRISRAPWWEWRR